MQRLKTLFATAVVATLGSLSSGCSDAESGIFIQGIIQGELDADAGVCTYTPGGSIWLEPQLDIGYGGVTSYDAVLSVGNQLISRADPDQLKPESNRVQFTEVDVEVYDFQGIEVSAYTVPAIGFADPSTGTSATYGVLHAPLVDSVAINALAGAAGQTIVSRVIARGITIGGVEVESGAWDVPIKFIDAGLCQEPETCDGELVGGACNIGSDSSNIDCRIVGQGMCF